MSMRTVVERLVAEAAHRWGMEQHGGEIVPFAESVADLAPRHVLEVGVRRGGTVALWHALATGLVIGVDLPEAVDLPAGFNAARHEELSEAYPRFRSVLADSQERATLARVQDLLHGEPLDLLFLDGDHAFMGVWHDLVTYGPLVRPGGLVALHDIVDTPTTRLVKCEVAKAWAALTGDKREFSIGGEWGGIGVLRVAP